MGKILILLTAILVLLAMPFISAEIILDAQPKEIYSLGDIVSVPVTVKSLADSSGILEMDFICGGLDSNFYKNGVALSAGEEKKFESALVLTKSVIGGLKGECRIKAFLGEDFILTNDFKVSDLITLVPEFEVLEFAPGEEIAIEGQAFKENGQEVNGFIEVSIIEGNSSNISQLGTINNGFFSLTLPLSTDMKAGAHLLKLEGYEEEVTGERTNTGFVDQNIVVIQIPTSLELVFDNKEVEPGTEVRVKAILHDQTGEKIDSSGSITIKNSDDKIIEQVEMKTDEFFALPISNSEPPSEDWQIVAASNQLTAESTFTILEKEEITIEIINKTLTVTNIGNIPYNKTTLVKIGEESLNIDILLDVEESQKYVLSAPDGEYTVEVVADGETTSFETLLTGKTIDVKKASSAVGSLVRYPFAWMFIIILLGVATFIVFKKGYQKTFIGYVTSKVKKKSSGIKSKTNNESKREVSSSHLSKKSLINSKNKAEVSLSIKGEKQNVSVLALNIKNLNELQSRETSGEQTLQAIVNMAEEEKAITYENHNTLFFIFAPGKTRTFKNEKTSLQVAGKAKSILDKYNKTAKQKISFGLSLNYGTIVAQQEQGTFKFMSMGTLITAAKKIASLSHGEILLGEKINDRLRTEVKTQKHEKGNAKVFSIKEIKNSEENEKFVRGFLKRIESDKDKKK